MKKVLKQLVNKLGYDIQSISPPPIRDLPRDVCAEAKIPIMDPLSRESYEAAWRPLFPAPAPLPQKYPFRFYKSVDEAVHNISMEQYFSTRREGEGAVLWDGDSFAYNTRQRMLHTVYTNLLGSSLSGHSVLDVGCSSGYYSFCCARAQASSVLGVDARPEHEDQFRLLHEMLGMPKTCEYRNVDMESGLESLQESYDLVLAQGVMYHVYDHPRFVKNLCRLTRKVLVLEGACSGRSDNLCKADIEDPTNLRESVHGPVLYPSLPWMIRMLRWAGFKDIRYVGHPAEVQDICGFARLWRAMLVAVK